MQRYVKTKSVLIILAISVLAFAVSEEALSAIDRIKTLVVAVLSARLF